MRPTIWYPFTPYVEVPAKTQSLGSDPASQRPKTSRTAMHRTHCAKHTAVSSLAGEPIHTLQGQNMLADTHFFHSLSRDFDE